MKDEATLSPAVVHAIRVREKFHEESMRPLPERQPAPEAGKFEYRNPKSETNPKFEFSKREKTV